MSKADKAGSDVDQLRLAAAVDCVRKAEHKKATAVAQLREAVREAQRRGLQLIDQVRAEAEHEREVAVRDARSTAEAAATETLAAERASWEAQAEQTVAEIQKAHTEAMAAAIEEAKAEAAQEVEEAGGVAGPDRDLEIDFQALDRALAVKDVSAMDASQASEAATEPEAAPTTG